MRSVINSVLLRLRAPASTGPHFHGSANGPYVCENARCESPGLSLDEA